MLKVHEEIEHVEGSTIDMVRSPAIKRIVVGYTVIAVTMALFSILTFILFYFLVFR